MVGSDEQGKSGPSNRFVRKRMMADINVTLMVDVMLVLLIIFMITAPMMFNGIEPLLPKTRKVNSVTITENQIVLSISRTSEYYIGRQKILWSEIIPSIQAKLKDPVAQSVFVRADFSVKYGAVAKVMAHLKRNNITKIALVTEIDKKVEEGR